MKIAIVGYGFVGKAVDAVFPTADKLLVDPKLNTSIEMLATFDPDFVFVCLPTPSNRDGSVNDELVVSTVKHIHQEYSGVIIIKSTIPPTTAKKFSSFELQRICINPEFLTERNAIMDMINSPYLVLGGYKNVCKQVKKLFNEYSSIKTNKFRIVSAEQACWIKYITNTMLAAKVALLNEYYREFEDKDSWYEVVKVLQLDSRLGGSHWQVPGLDNKFGFGGACLPKDLNALLHITKNLSILETVAKSNNLTRLQYSLDTREQQQNINYKDTN